ncbi:MAG: TonB-dependent receptor [Methylotenera sp.]|uniref:TonB-dependent siderophore receptor n=1 Tax=Methylotenera sp. TaxID=2051956 RepID=UPI001817DCFA|nr:TonB-dependent receptor [Methylotenera sp.]NOU25609.1 TonB-dependent receptor [Methylotenera sp.]
MIKKLTLSTLLLCSSQVVLAEDTVNGATEANATQLDSIQVRATQETGYAVKNSSSATKTDTPIKEIPQSIQVLPRQLMDDQQNVTVGEALKNVSGVVTNDAFSTPSFEATKIRGFKAEQLLDGFTQYYNSGDRESLVNVQKIEVLKGSNAVLFSGGSGSPVGGVVNITSKLPQANAFGELGVKVGTDSFVQPFFDINQPINDNVLFRITGEYTRADSNTDVVEQKRYNINPVITFTNNETTSLTLQGKVSRWRQQDYQGLPATGTVAGNFKLKSKLFIGDKGLPDSTTEFDGIWATLDHKLNDVWSFNVKGRYAESEFDQKAQALSGNSPDRADISPTSFSIYNTQLFQEQTEKTILANATAKFDWGATKNTVLLGADYSKFKDKGFIDLDAAFDADTLKVLAAGALVFPAPADCATAALFSFPCSTPVDLTNPSFTPYSKPGAGVNNNFVTNTTYGAYAQWQSTIADRLHLLASLRQAHVEIDFTGPELDMTATINNALLGNFVSVYQQANANTEKNKLLPRVGTVFDVTDSISVFANYSEGLRGQPFALFSGTPKPEETRQREAGIKVDTGNLTGQLAIYHIDRSNVAISDPASLTRSLTNGEQRSRGFETDLTWQATPSLKFLGNYAYTDAEFTKNASTTVVSGNQLQGVPKNSARLWANYNFASLGVSGLSAGLGAYWQSEAYVDNANTFKADSYHTIDAAINYQTARYNVGLTVKNLTNEDYYQFYNYLGGRIAPDNGTQAYLSVSMKY